MQIKTENNENGLLIGWEDGFGRKPVFYILNHKIR
jgi:hypothetical protein